MENLYFDSKNDLNNYLNEHTVRRLGANVGKDGYCCLLDNGMVAKFLYDEFLPAYALQFKDFNYRSFVFAKSAAFVGEYVKTVFMDFAPGKSLYEERPLDQRLDVLGDSLEVLTGDIVAVSERGLFVKDFHPGNIIYDGYQFRIIDTFPYLLLPNGIFTKENFFEVMNRLYNCLLEEVLRNQKVRARFSFWGNLNYLENPKEYLLAIKSFIEEMTNQEVNTLKEAHLALTKK